jgi:hypothetical protein
VDWHNLTQDTNQRQELVNTIINIRISCNAGNFSTTWGAIDFSRRTLIHGASSNVSVTHYDVDVIILCSLTF